MFKRGKMQVLENCPFQFKYPNFEDLILEHREDHNIFVWLIWSLKAACRKWITFLGKSHTCDLI